MKWIAVWTVNGVIRHPASYEDGDRRTVSEGHSRLYERILFKVIRYGTIFQSLLYLIRESSQMNTPHMVSDSIVSSYSVIPAADVIYRCEDLAKLSRAFFINFENVSVSATHGGNLRIVDHYGDPRNRCVSPSSASRVSLIIVFYIPGVVFYRLFRLWHLNWKGHRSWVLIAAAMMSAIYVIAVSCILQLKGQRKL